MTLQDYVKAALDKGADCKNCGKLAEEGELEHYDHSDGWVVDGFTTRRWLYFRCSKCSYQTSFAKLGFKRPQQ